MGAATAVGDGESFALGPIAELPDHEFESADAAELPVLRALLRISRAVMRATFFDEALEVIAEQTLLPLGAASVPISRWEPHVDAVRTLINGALGPDEERWPDDEPYSAAGDQPVSRLLHSRRPYIVAIDGKDCELAVPVMYRDVMSGGWRYAYQDPLTGLANCRLNSNGASTKWTGRLQVPRFLCATSTGSNRSTTNRATLPATWLLKRVATVLGDLTTPNRGRHRDPLLGSVGAAPNRRPHRLPAGPTISLPHIQSSAAKHLRSDGHWEV